MNKAIKRIFLIVVSVTAACFILFILLSLFFDEAVLLRKGTFYRLKVHDKIIALTFDDGPSPVWTPKILDELKKAGIKATFFMVGDHVEKYPDIAQRVLREGHEIGNHSYDHHVLLYYKVDELTKEIRRAQTAIENATGITTKYFRPPKAWLTSAEKKRIDGMGYKIVLWSLNSKDWVTFHDKQITSYILRHIRPGDILLFHDSGGALSSEGGDRTQTVKTIPRLARKLKEKGYRFVTISELMENVGE